MIAWSNLRKMVGAYAGWHGRTPRTLLTLWELLLWTIVGVGVWCGALWGAGPIGWRVLTLTGGALLGGLGAGLIAFIVHELCFQAWIVHVAQIKVADTGDQVGVERAAVATIERWIGPVQ